MLRIPKYLEKKVDQPVAIFGSGISGHGVADLLEKLSWKYIFFDKDGKAFTEIDAEKCSIVITSPGFTFDHHWIKIAEKSNLPIYGEIDFASIFCDNPVIAVTGTNGKTTLVTLLNHLWNNLGRPSICAGNIGTPLSKAVSEGLDPWITIFLEVSSFQAQRISLLRPNSLIWTNFSPDHLDHHLNISEYFLAKANLIKQLDSAGSFICGTSVTEFAEQNKIQLIPSPKVINADHLKNFDLERNHFLATFPQKENIALAFAFAQKSGINQNDFTSTIQTYQAEPSRFSWVDEVNEVSFWNDSKATNFAATLAACRNFKEKIIWIGGGREKGECLKEFSRQLKKYVTHALLIGEGAEKLSYILERRSISYTLCQNIPEAVNKAFQLAKRGSHVVFSPGFASFDMFKDYLERGNIFNRVVFDLKKRLTPCTQDCIL